MDKQITLSAFSDELANIRTKKKEFLAQIERIIPWEEWFAMIQPCYYKRERGNKPYPLELMLRLFVLQNLYDLADEATVAEVIDSRAFSEFCGVDSSNQVPDGDTLGRFRNLLIRNGLQEKLFAQVVELLQVRGLILKKGTIVDSTIISAPSSTKNKEKKRDPDAHQAKKRLSTETAAILGLISVKTLWCATRTARKSSARSIAGHLKSRSSAKVGSMLPNTENMKSPPYEQKWSTFLVLSRNNFNPEKHDTEVCENRLLN